MLDKNKNNSKNNSKNNIFLNNKTTTDNAHKKNNNQEEQLSNNRFSSEIGKQTKRENKTKEINMNDVELFPSLLNEYELYNVSKTIKKTQQVVSYKDITNNEEKTIKIETDDLEPGWVNLFRDENNKIIKVYGKTTPECLELERKEREIKQKKEREEFNLYMNEIEFERNLRKELYGDIIDFYDPMKDKFYTKEKDIVIYTANELSESDSEGSYDIHDNTDYLNDDNYL